MTLTNEQRLEVEATELFVWDADEIYSDELTFQEIVQAVKKEYPNTLKLHFRAYDVINEHKQKDRLDQLAVLVASIGSPYIVKVAHQEVDGSSQVSHFHDMWVKEGYEGAMIRLRDGKYEQGSRSRSLLKVKEFDEGEFEILGGKLYKVDLPLTGADEVSDRDADSFTFTCKHPVNGVIFDVKPMGTRQQRTDYVLNLSNYIGKQITVKHFGWTDDGVPRFPIGKAVRDYDI